MDHRPNTTEPVRSAFADDPDMRELVVEFVASLDQRISQLHALLLEGDTAGLQRVAHQLKGAGGGYGFDAISGLAGEVERALEDDLSLEEVRARVQRLVVMCRRAAA